MVDLNMDKTIGYALQESWEMLKPKELEELK